jgi:4'-phosphopantetheinyl transferase EntD
MIESCEIFSLLPPKAAAAEITSFADASPLFPEEEAELGEVAEERRRDFTMGRHCARLALARLGLGPLPILRGASREPLWPAGICGSITHCEGYSAAAVALRSDIQSIGVDAESVRPLSDSEVKLIALETERCWIAAADPRVPWSLLLFSAKESIFKAWFQIMGTWLGFEQARIEFHPSAGRFRAAILQDQKNAERNFPTEFVGRFCATSTMVITTAFLPV